MNSEQATITVVIFPKTFAGIIILFKHKNKPLKIETQSIASKIINMYNGNTPFIKKAIITQIRKILSAKGSKISPNFVWVFVNLANKPSNTSLKKASKNTSIANRGRLLI